MIFASLVLLAAIHTPEECFVGPPASSPAGPAASRRRGSEDAPGPAGGTHAVHYDGKTYNFRFADCREEFLTDPERYSQLYDALAQLHAEGVKIESAPPSLVPS